MKCLLNSRVSVAATLSLSFLVSGTGLSAWFSALEWSHSCEIKIRGKFSVCFTDISYVILRCMINILNIFDGLCVGMGVGVCVCVCTCLQECLYVHAF